MSTTYWQLVQRSIAGLRGETVGRASKVLAERYDNSYNRQLAAQFH